MEEDNIYDLLGINDTNSQGVERSEPEKPNPQNRNWKVFKWGCLAPLALIILTAIIMFGGDHPQDAGGLVGLFVIGYLLVFSAPILAIVWLIWFIVVYRYTKK